MAVQPYQPPPVTMQLGLQFNGPNGFYILPHPREPDGFQLVFGSHAILFDGKATAALIGNVMAQIRPTGRTATDCRVIPIGRPSEPSTPGAA